MRKWRDIERQMAPSSQTFSQGGIRSRDWFSDRLNRQNTAGDSVIQFAFCVWRNFSTLWKSLTCSEHYTSQWWRAPTRPWSWGRVTRTRGSPDHQTLDCRGRTGGSGSVGRKAGEWGGGRDPREAEWSLSDWQTYQLVQGDLRTIFRHCKPPGCSSHCGCAHIPW